MSAAPEPRDSLVGLVPSLAAFAVLVWLVATALL